MADICLYNKLAFNKKKFYMIISIILISTIQFTLQAQANDFEISDILDYEKNIKNFNTLGDEGFRYNHEYWLLYSILVIIVQNTFFMAKKLKKLFYFIFYYSHSCSYYLISLHNNNNLTNL